MPPLVGYQGEQDAGAGMREGEADDTHRELAARPLRLCPVGVRD